ncbi:elongation factor Ts [Candidatus Photodesmus blepharus]|uniref:Elongation factor Ts n=1 Tax=Candidatus Photodesmus blepharonis TaxID=1179155 RepID=A0A084CNX5_9GAMM|nr:translation elongation factor Ts [Candidatus Photodesmus blepharus]KEY91504.1 elongation factor Ts [Candidatus Photodesmus blepharus]
MVAVTAALVKELRARTGAGMMECKKALVEANADVELAIENMRKFGVAKAAKKARNVAAEGIIAVKEVDDFALLLEVNCQTDFVARDASFIDFVNKVAEFALISKASVNDLKMRFEKDRVILVTKIGENVDIRRVQYIEGSKLVSYCHGKKIGVVVSGEGDVEALKHVAMQIAASRPEFLKPEDIPPSIIEKEKDIQIELAMNEGKSADIVKQVVMGRIRKFTGEISLTTQAFIMEPKKSVGEMLRERFSSVSTFIRLEVGEGLDKAENISFAEEVSLVQKG